MPTDRVYDPRHKLTDLPEWRSTDPTGLAGPGGAVQTANGARRRQAWRGFETTHRAGAPPSPDGRAHIQRARARGTHTTRPGPAARNSTTEPRPREKIKPSDPP